MIFNGRFHTIVFKDLTPEQRRDLVYHSAFSAGSWSHALNDRDDLLYALSRVEEDLSEVTEGNSERIGQTLADVRKVLREHGRLPKPQKTLKNVLDDNYVGLI